MGRRILGMIAGAITAFAVIGIVQMIGTMFASQPPKNIEYMTAEEIAAFVASLPLGTLLTFIFGYMLGSLAGGWMATKVTKERHNSVPSLIVGIILTIVGLVNFFVVFPGQPAWFVAVSLLIYIPVSLLGHRLAR